MMSSIILWWRIQTQRHKKLREKGQTPRHHSSPIWSSYYLLYFCGSWTKTWCAIKSMWKTRIKQICLIHLWDSILSDFCFKSICVANVEKCLQSNLETCWDIYQRGWHDQLWIVWLKRSHLYQLLFSTLKLVPTQRYWCWRPPFPPSSTTRLPPSIDRSLCFYSFRLDVGPQLLISVAPLFLACCWTGLVICSKVSAREG